MLKVIDVDLITDYNLALIFSDGFKGTVDLEGIFSTVETSSRFDKFALDTDGSLRWENITLTANELRDLSVGQLSEDSNLSSLEEIEVVIKSAAWESMQEGRPDILQAAIRGYVEKFGHQRVIAKAGIKSRTSAYRSLKPDTTPNFGTLVQLGRAVIELAGELSEK